MIDDCTGIFGNNDQDDVKIYPNPAENYINIDFQSAADTEIEILIYNTVGQLVLEQKGNSKILGSDYRMDVSPLSKGLYFIRIKSDWASVSQQFIKR